MNYETITYYETVRHNSVVNETIVESLVLSAIVFTLVAIFNLNMWQYMFLLEINVHIQAITDQFENWCSTESTNSKVLWAEINVFSDDFENHFSISFCELHNLLWILCYPLLGTCLLFLSVGQILIALINSIIPFTSKSFITRFDLCLYLFFAFYNNFYKEDYRSTLLYLGF